MAIVNASAIAVVWDHAGLNARAPRRVCWPDLSKASKISKGLEPSEASAQAIGGNRRPAVFIDKDGTLVHNVPYNVDPARLSFTPHAIEGLKLLAAFGYAIVIISNQPGLALRKFDLASWYALCDELHARLQRAGVPLSAVYACPHAPASADMACGCRKPRPGMLHRAAQQLSLDLRQSWMIGDILDDVEAGTRAGCRSILLDCGNETEWRDAPLRRPLRRAQDLFDAADFLVRFDQQRADAQQRSSAQQAESARALASARLAEPLAIRPAYASVATLPSHVAAVMTKVAPRELAPYTA